MLLFVRWFGALSHKCSKLRVLYRGCSFICHKDQDDRSLWQPSAAAQGSVGELQRLCQEGYLDKALDILVRMDKSGAYPSVNMFALVLRACAKRKALPQVKLVYAHMAKCGLESTTFLGEHVVSTMVKCGGLDDAVELFHKLPNPTVFSWTALISGYTLAGQAQQALTTYRLMRDTGLKPNNYTLVCLCRACGSLRDLEEGKRIYTEAMKYRKMWYHGL